MKLRSSVHDVHLLGAGERDAMFQLMAQTYANMQRDRFDSDLDAKRWVILVRSPETDAIVGFSTQVLLKTCVGGKMIHALYSGDTVVDRRHWGDPALAHAWGNFALALIDRHRRRAMYWLLTSKGFRTYRYLPLFFRAYFPRYDAPTPDSARRVIDALGMAVGGGRYDPSANIIRASEGQEFVRPELGRPGSRLDTDSPTRFFVERNPGYARGDELCCLAPLTRDNFTRAAYRVIGSRTEPLPTA